MPGRETLVVLKPKNTTAATEPPVSSGASEAAVQKVTLPNGLRIFVREDHRLPLATLSLTVFGGTRFESADLNGLSFLTSQVWVGGTLQKTPSQLRQELEAKGMSLGAFSANSRFGLQLDFLAADTDFALDLLEALIVSPRFDVEEFNDIKQNMKTDIERRQDSISKLSSLKMKGILFPQHPFRFDEEGTLESVGKISLKDVRRFYQDLVVPNNMVLAVFGDVKAAVVIAKLKIRLASLQPRPVVVPRFTASALAVMKEETFRMDKKQSMVMLGLPASRLEDPDRYALEVLSEIFASPFRGRLFTTIREQFGQSYTLGGSYVPLLDTGLIYFYVLTSPQNVGAVRTTLLNIIAGAQKGGVTDSELRDAKEYLKGTFAMGLQTNAALADRCLQDELYGVGCEAYRSYAPKIDAVTLRDVERLAKTYFDLKRAALVVANPAP